MVAKEKTSSRWTAWLAPILFLLAAVAAAGPASVLTCGALQTRAWEKTSSPLESRPVESLQLLNLHQQNESGGYDSALGSPLAAEDTSGYIASLPTRPAVGSGASQAFQIANAGSTEYLISGGGTQLWADGIESSTILESKFVGNPSSSPFITGSSIPDAIRANILGQVEGEFSRMSQIIADPSNPLSSVRVITNDSAANPYFQSLLKKYGLDGEVVNP